MSRTSLQEFLASPRKVDVLCGEVLNLIDECQNPIFDRWDDTQKSNRAAMFESSALIFSVLDYLTESPSSKRSPILGAIVDDIELVDPNLLFDTVLGLLKIANRSGARRLSVDLIVVRDLSHAVSHLWRDVLTPEERYIFSGYVSSEKPLYLIKNKLTAAQVSEILTELTKDSCPFRKTVPPYILLPMETIAATANFVSWLGDTSMWSTGTSKPLKRKMTIKPQKTVSSFINTPEDRESSPKQGIDIFPVARPRGVQIGTSKSRSKRIDFRVHNDTLLRRLTALIW